ncbi:hypothetical protein MML48_3g00010902 [Holotrichia oblita]|uniref:Uncharacterized protein n=1 Tax=Holotrichia oblita TaxID=644536 RepID=A0ACB9TF87_HOLOL|nr:hypothetical protein MML48_3g00010902 [Holotrichia oblita]
MTQPVTSLVQQNYALNGEASRCMEDICRPSSPRGWTPQRHKHGCGTEIFCGDGGGDPCDPRSGSTNEIVPTKNSEGQLGDNHMPHMRR